ncbi:MAG TPA: hypothetical protein VK172_04630 [Lentimicrobium sp.]|nr:hypothetical protein [Lentimicrobium sp.]
MKEFIHQTEIDNNIVTRLPGYLLVENNEDENKILRVLEEGMDRFFAGFGEFAHLYDLGKYKFALMIPEKISRYSCVSFFRENEDFAFIEGTFYDYELLKNNKKESISQDLAKEILDIAKKEDYEKFKEYNGRYSGFAFVKDTGKLSVITDSYGANRVFVYKGNDVFAISNNVYALSTNPELKVSVNEQSIAEILHYEYPSFRGTEFNEIELVLPSDILIRKDKVNKVVKSFQKVFRKKVKSEKEYIEELRTAIDEFFIRTSNYMKVPFGIYLSKGKDSRLFLTFLERNILPYIPFVFKEDTGIFDYPQVKQVTELLHKDLHVLEKHSIDLNLAFLTSMNTTPTTAWLALGKVVANYTDNALMGLYGESSSGKLCAYRNYGVRDKESSIKATILGNSKGITREEVIKWFPYFEKWNSDATFREIYVDYPSVDIPFDFDTYQDIDHRSFRNAIVILTRSQHFITPITPYMDKRIADVYHRLPHSLLKSQIAHTIIAAEEEKSNKIRSTAFPVSLKNERYFRNFLMEMVRLNNKFKDVLMANLKKDYKPYVPGEIFTPKSDYFNNILSGKPLVVKHPRILTRLHNVDHYLYMTFQDDLKFYFRTPVIVQNEFSKVRSGINSSIIN